MPTKKDSRSNPPAPELPPALATSVTWAISRLDADLRAAVDAALADAPVTLRGYWLLEATGDGATHSQRELCDLLGVDRSDMVRLVDVLEDAGLVERVRDSADRRRQLIGPTPAGARARDVMRAAIADAESRVVSAAPAPMRAAVRAALDAAPEAAPEAAPDPTAVVSASGTAPGNEELLDDANVAPKKPKKKRKNKKKAGKK